MGHIKQGKPSGQDIDAIADFLEWLEAEMEDPETSLLTNIRDRIPSISGWRRVVHGCATLVDNCCDPNLDYLEFKPEIQQCLEPSQAHLDLKKFIADRGFEISQALEQLRLTPVTSDYDAMMRDRAVVENQAKLAAYSHVLTWLAQHQLADTSDRHWRVTAEATLSQLDLLKDLPSGESVTPDRFRELLSVRLAEQKAQLRNEISDLDRVFSALEINQSPQIDNAIAQIENLQAWKEVAQYTCHRLLVSYDAIPSFDAIADAVSIHSKNRSSVTLREAILNWADAAGECWISTRLDIAESLVKELLTEILENPDATADEVNILITGENLLRDSIDIWTHRNLDESWNVELLSIAVKLVNQLLVTVRDRSEELTDESELIPMITPLTVVEGEIETDEPSLRSAIVHWGKQQSAAWVKDARLDGVVSTVEKVLKQYTMNKLGVFESLLGQNGIYRVSHPEESAELEQVGRLQDWNRFVEVVEGKEAAFKLPPPLRTTIIDRAIRVMIVQHREHIDQLKAFQNFQSDVIGYLRALALVIESAANGGTHAEKDARFRGVIALLESSIDKVRNSHQSFVGSHWWNTPDLFRSDYPVRPLLDRVHQLENELKKLKGTDSEASAEAPDNLIF